MSLDTSTLYLVAAMVAAMLGAMLLFVGSQENIPALRWWGTAYLLGAASIALWTLAASSLGEMLSLALNAVGFLACGMVWNASRVFHGRKPNVPGLVLGARRNSIMCARDGIAGRGVLLDIPRVRREPFVRLEEPVT